MTTHFERLVCEFSDCVSDRSFICRLFGYVENDVISKMSKIELACILQDVQFLLRYAYERGSFNDKR